VHVLQIGSYPMDKECIVGGVEASVYGVATSLVGTPHHHQVTVLTPPEKHYDDRVQHVSFEDTALLTVHHLNLQGKGYASGIKRLPLAMKKIKEIQPDVIHMHGAGPFVYILLCLLKVWTRYPIIYTVHGILHKETRDRYAKKPSLKAWIQCQLYSMGERISIMAANHVIVDTPLVVDGLKRHMSLDTVQMSVIPQGIFLHELEPYRTTHPQTSNTIVSLGVISPRKGYHHLISAFKKLSEQVPLAQLTIMGICRDEGYYTQLYEQITALDLANRVTIYKNLPRSAILQHLHGARFCALHSQEESQGIALCEAMAMGLPIVSTKVGGIPNVVQDGLSGLLSPFGDIEAFTHNLLTYFDDATLIKAAHHACIQGQSFDWGAITHKIVEVYQQYCS
jgi:glycosyltransferase involved in cell wall biosynthesis